VITKKLRSWSRKGRAELIIRLRRGLNTITPLDGVDEDIVGTQLAEIFTDILNTLQ